MGFTQWGEEHVVPTGTSPKINIMSYWDGGLREVYMRIWHWAQAETEPSASWHLAWEEWGQAIWGIRIIEGETYAFTGAWDQTPVLLEIPTFDASVYEIKLHTVEGGTPPEDSTLPIVPPPPDEFGEPIEPPPPPPPENGEYSLTVESNPLTGVPFTINGQQANTPKTFTLTEGAHTVVMPSSVVVGEDIYNFKVWENGSENPERTVNLIADLVIIATYEKPSLPPETPPSATSGILEIHAFLGENQVSASGVVIETLKRFKTPARLVLEQGNYDVYCRYRIRPKLAKAEVVAGQTSRLDLQFKFVLR